MIKFMLATLGAVAEMKRKLTVEWIRKTIAKAKVTAQDPAAR